MLPSIYDVAIQHRQIFSKASLTSIIRSSMDSTPTDIRISPSEMPAVLSALRKKASRASSVRRAERSSPPPQGGGKGAQLHFIHKGFRRRRRPKIKADDSSKPG